MSSFTCEINVNEKSTKNHLLFEIKGNEEYGMNRTIVNAIKTPLMNLFESGTAHIITFVPSINAIN